MDTDMQNTSTILSDREHRVTKTLYRHAIIKAIEGLCDFQSRSNVDLIRRHTQIILEGHAWNDKLFLKTLKAIVRDGEIEQCALHLAELSPEYKKKRANSLTQRIEERLLSTAPHVPEHPTQHHSLLHNQDLKIPPKRRTEHDKWKIMPKKIYDKTMYAT